MISNDDFGFIDEDFCLSPYVLLFFHHLTCFVLSDVLELLYLTKFMLKESTDPEQKK